VAYNLRSLIAIYANEIGLPHHQVRQLLSTGDITWSDLLSSVDTFALKCQSSKALNAFLNPTVVKEMKSKRNTLNTLIAQRQNSKDPVERLNIEKEIDRIQFRGMTREELVERSRRIAMECEAGAENENRLERRKII